MKRGLRSVSSHGAALAVVSLTALALPSAAATHSAASAPPVNVASPTISGTPVEGATLAAESGSWSSDTPLSFAYLWLLCDASGAGCAAVAGGTGQSHVVSSGEVGGSLRVRVTATNASGAAEALSPQTAVVAMAEAPGNTGHPAITGTARDGSTLTTSDGTWTGAPTPAYTYEWKRCSRSGTDCVLVPSQTSRTYRISVSDVGLRLRSVVTASNLAGSTSSESAATGIVEAAAAAPRAVSQPNVLGTLRVGSTLTSETGQWTGSAPLTFAYSWQRCSAAGRCVQIAGAVRQTYLAVNTDVGYRMRAIVTASNAFGARSIATNLTAAPIAAGGAPVLTSVPRLTGATKAGSTLTTTAGTWTGAPNLRYAYAWLRCDVRGSACIAVAGADQSTYKLTPADIGHTMRARVTANDAAGATSAISNESALVAAASPPVKPSVQSGVVDADDVVLPQRLVISGVTFTPLRLTSRAPFTARFRVTDTRGNAVRNALVYVIGLPYGVLDHAPETRTDGSGYATMTLQPTSRLSLRGGAIVMFVRARNGSGSLLAGVSTRRLVQVVVGR